MPIALDPLKPGKGQRRTRDGFGTGGLGVLAEGGLHAVEVQVLHGVIGVEIDIAAQLIEEVRALKPVHDGAFDL